MTLEQWPKEFNQCPICGCPDTVCRLAYQQEVVDKGKGPDVFASSERRGVPLTDPKTAALTVPTLVEHFDTCAKCGLRYCTKAEIQQAQIKIIPGRGSQMPFSPS